jgi:hypothetical protein
MDLMAFFADFPTNGRVAHARRKAKEKCVSREGFAAGRRLSRRASPSHIFLCDLTIDQLEVWQAPEAEQLRPGNFTVLIPHPKEGDAMVNFRIPASAGLAAATCLKAAQQFRLVTRGIPELPCHYARTVPIRIPVGTRTPEIDTPPETINCLTA